MNLNPLRLFTHADHPATQEAPAMTPALTPSPETVATQPVVAVAVQPVAAKTRLQKFESVLQVIGRDFAKGLSFAVTYSVPVERLIALLFPGAPAAVAVTVANATQLVQTAVLQVEQKYAAAGVQNGTGKQKLGEVLTLVQPVVLQLLGQAGITADSSFVANLVSAVVAILNVQAATAA